MCFIWYVSFADMKHEGRHLRHNASYVAVVCPGDLLQLVGVPVVVQSEGERWMVSFRDLARDDRSEAQGGYVRVGEGASFSSNGVAACRIFKVTQNPEPQTPTRNPKP